MQITKYEFRGAKIDKTFLRSLYNRTFSLNDSQFIRNRANRYGGAVSVVHISSHPNMVRLFRDFDESFDDELNQKIYSEYFSVQGNIFSEN